VRGVVKEREILPWRGQDERMKEEGLSISEDASGKEMN